MRHVKGKLQADKKYIQELAEKYPTASNRTRLTESGRMTAQWKEQQWLGSQGAASEVRHIDPATVDLSRYIGAIYEQFGEHNG